jgi:urease accessory protein
MTTHRHLLRYAVAVAGLLPAIALAHPGHGDTASFAAGALHPLGGFDHLLGLVAVGVLVSRLGGRFVGPIAAALAGLFVAACTADSDGWRYAAGFMFTSAGLIAASSTATRLLVSATTAAGPRSPI